MSKICNLECDAFCDAGDEENCPRYKEYRDELLKHCIAVYEHKIRTEAFDELVGLIETNYGYDYASDIKPLVEYLKEQKNG